MTRDFTLIEFSVSLPAMCDLLTSSVARIASRRRSAQIGFPYPVQLDE